MRKLGAAVIGLRMGRSHLIGYQNNPHTEIRAVCDLDPERLRQVAGEFGVELATTDYRTFLNDPDIDIVSIATPDYCHTEQALAAMQAGKHVLVEKPMALTLEECEAMIRASDETGMKLMVGQVCRFTPAFKLAKSLIDEGTIGELYYLECDYAHNYEHVPGVGGWRKDSRREPLLGGGCHAIDLIRWIGGEITEGFGYANHKALPDWPVNDTTIAIYKFKNGTMGKVLCSIGARKPYTIRATFYGTQGAIIAENTANEIQVYQAQHKEMSGYALFPVNVSNHNVGDEIAELVDAVVQDRPLQMNGREGARTIAAGIAVIESVRTGMPTPVQPIV
jgi:UDP-N-acetylglucosamine 3-dehydrogenase